MTKKKTSDVPTRIYSFRCLPPTTEAKRVEDQYRLAHQYRNAHVEIELRLRDRIRQVQLGVPEVALALNHYESADGAVEDTYDELRAAKSGTANPDLSAHRERPVDDHLTQVRCERRMGGARGQASERTRCRALGRTRRGVLPRSPSNAGPPQPTGHDARETTQAAGAARAVESLRDLARRADRSAERAVVRTEDGRRRLRVQPDRVAYDDRGRADLGEARRAERHPKKIQSRFRGAKLKFRFELQI